LLKIKERGLKMEEEHLKVYEGHNVVIRISNGYKYNGLIVKVEKGDILFCDRFLGDLVIACDDIKFIAIGEED